MFYDQFLIEDDTVDAVDASIIDEVEVMLYDHDHKQQLEKEHDRQQAKRELTYERLKRAVIEKQITKNERKSSIEPNCCKFCGGEDDAPQYCEKAGIIIHERVLEELKQMKHII
jgi:hypothetical protein